MSIRRNTLPMGDPLKSQVCVMPATCLLEKPGRDGTGSARVLPTVQRFPERGLTRCVSDSRESRDVGRRESVVVTTYDRQMDWSLGVSARARCALLESPPTSPIGSPQWLRSPGTVTRHPEDVGGRWVPLVRGSSVAPPLSATSASPSRGTSVREARRSRSPLGQRTEVRPKDDSQGKNRSDCTEITARAPRAHPASEEDRTVVAGADVRTQESLRSLETLLIEPGSGDPPVLLSEGAAASEREDAVGGLPQRGRFSGEEARLPATSLLGAFGTAWKEHQKGSASNLGPVSNMGSAGSFGEVCGSAGSLDVASSLGIVGSVVLRSPRFASPAAPVGRLPLERSQYHGHDTGAASLGSMRELFDRFDTDNDGRADRQGLLQAFWESQGVPMNAHLRWCPVGGDEAEGGEEGPRTMTWEEFGFYLNGALHSSPTRRSAGSSLRGSPQLTDGCSEGRGSRAHSAPPESAETSARTRDLAQGYERKPVSEWDVEDVTAWMTSLSTVPTALLETLHEHAITGAVLLSLTEDDFKAMGIDRFGHRRLLSLATRELRALVNGQATARGVVAPATMVVSPPSDGSGAAAAAAAAAVASLANRCSQPPTLWRAASPSMALGRGASVRVPVGRSCSPGHVSPPVPLTRQLSSQAVGSGSTVCIPVGANGSPGHSSPPTQAVIARQPSFQVLTRSMSQTTQAPAPGIAQSPRPQVVVVSSGQASGTSVPMSPGGGPPLAGGGRGIRAWALRPVLSHSLGEVAGSSPTPSGRPCRVVPQRIDQPSRGGSPNKQGAAAGSSLTGVSPPRQSSWTTWVPSPTVVRGSWSPGRPTVVAASSHAGPSNGVARVAPPPYAWSAR